MDQYPFGDENGNHLEMHFPGFPESQELLCSEALDCNLCPTAKGMSYTGLSGLDADAAGDALEADLNMLSLYLVKDCGSGQLDGSDWQPWQHELGLPVLTGPEEAGGGGSISRGSGKPPLGPPQSSPLGCNRCGKVFGSASALSKHCLSHSQKREHVCAICNKAFKRPDHLSGHVLTHQEKKPFVCPERDCDKSYCNHRSLRRHYGLRHGLREAHTEHAGEESSLLPTPYIQGGGKSADGLSPCSESGSFPPERDLLRGVASQKRPVGAFPSGERVGAASTGLFPPSQASCLASDGSGLAEDDLSKDCSSCQRNAASSSVFTIINPAEVPAVALGENVVTDLTSLSLILEPAGLQCCPDGTLPCFPALRGQKPPENHSSGNFERMRSVPVCAKSERNSVCLAPGPPVAAEGCGKVQPTFSVACECPDASPFPAAPLKAEEDVLSESAPGCLEETFQSVKPHDSCPLENARELSFPEVPKRGEVGQLVPKPPEPAACPEPLQMPQLFQAITDSPPAAPEAACLAANPLRQQQPAFAPQLPQPTGYEGLSALLPAVPTFPGASSGQGTQAAPVKEHVAFRESSVPHQPPLAAESCSSWSSNQLENKVFALKKEKSNDGSAETGGKAPVGAGWSWHPPAGRREKLGLSRVAPPSQVAMASFSAAPAAPRRLTIFNRIQGGNIYSLTRVADGARSPAGCDTTSAAPADGSGCESGVLRQRCLRLFCTEKGLESHGCFRGERWHSAQGKEEQQVCHAGGAGTWRLSLRAAGDGNHPSKPQVPSGDVTAAPLVIPVSVPVTAPNSLAGNEVTGKEGRDGKDLKENLCQKKRPTRPKSLFIPPPTAPDAQPGTGGCYRSNLRSPAFLVDHLLRDLFQRSPYTPPPMLSPLREGSGLYFSTLCSSSASGDPNQLFSAVLGGADRDFGLCLMKYTTKVSVQPHINVGKRYQAEIPELQCRSSLDEDEEAGLLVWKPWGDIATNAATQDRVTELLNAACSSTMPGGGTNLELALHCLHEARGSILEALEMLLFGVPQKSESHPLADYHYAGSDIWTSLEKKLFKKALSAHGKDFHLIQKKIQTKSVSQCVEYYYMWKKSAKFDYSRIIGKKLKRHNNEVEEAEKKAVRNPKQPCLPRKEDGKVQRKREKKTPCGSGSASCGQDEAPCQAGGADDRSVFPCSKCGRVFDKIKGRNAHMKRHRPQDKSSEDEMVLEASGSKGGGGPEAGQCLCS